MKLSDFILDKDTEVIYFDETSFHSRMIQKRAWWKKGKRFKIPSTQIRGRGFTLFGAISHCLKNEAYFEVHKSTKGTCFMSFMKNLQNHILPEYKDKRLIMCIDNHSAHKGPAKIEKLEEFCEVHFIPPYSCELNEPIETAWSVIKARVIPKITQLQLKKQSSREACIHALKKELTKIEP